MEARSQRVNPDVGSVGRSVVDGEGPIKARGRVNTSTGRPKREAEPEAEVEALADRGHIVPYPDAALAIPVGDLVERARGSRPGGEESAADPRKFKSAGSSRREAEPTKRDIGFPPGGSSTDSRPISNEGLAKRGAIVTWPRTPDAGASNDVAERGNAVPWTPKRDADRAEDLIERDPGLLRHPGGSPKRGLTPSRGGSYRREAEPIRISSSRGDRREAETVERSMKNPGGGNRDDSKSTKLGSPGGHRREAEPAKWGGTSRREAVPEAKNGLNVSAGGGCPRDAAPISQPINFGCRRDAAPQPNRIGGGISGGRRDADAETIEARQRMNSGTGRGRRDAIPGFVRPGGGTRPRDAISGIVRPFGGTRVPRGIRGSGANPRGVRPGNGNNQ